MRLPLRWMLCLTCVLTVPAWSHTAHKHAPAASAAAPEQKEWGIVGDDVAASVTSLSGLTRKPPKGDGGGARQAPARKRPADDEEPF